MTSTVTIDGFVFYGDGTSDEQIYEKFAGWYSGAPVRADVENNPTSDGASPVGIAYRSARVMRFEGTLAADSSAEAIGLWMRFAALQSDGKPFPVTVVDPFGTLTCPLVSVSGVPEVLEITNEGADVVVSLVAYDPVKYGLPRTVSTSPPTAGGGLTYPLFDPAGTLDYGANGNLGRVSLTNAGTARVWPSLLVTGGLTAGFFVQRLDTGQVVRYDRVVPAGSTVAIDFRTGEALIDGLSDGSTFLTRYEFFSVGPGQTIEVQLNPISGVSGSPTAAFTLSDGFW